MTQETWNWLDNNILAGNGHKSWWLVRSQGGYMSEGNGGTGYDDNGEANHYEGFIPVEDVARRLFNFDWLEQPVFSLDANGDAFQVENKKAIMRSDTSYVAGIFSDGYKPHQYRETLIGIAEKLINGIGIGAAGLIQNGAKAWVQFRMPEQARTRHGVSFHAWLMACTAHDGSLATTFKDGNTVAICDNTFAAFMAEAGTQVKVRHTKYSESALVDQVGNAFNLIEQNTVNTTAAIDALIETPVTGYQWNDFLKLWVPIPEDEGRSKSLAETKRDQLVDLYEKDDRVTHWKGTAFGVLQACNTHFQHVANQRGELSRVERNMLNTLSGKVDETDTQVLQTMQKVGILQAA